MRQYPRKPPQTTHIRNHPDRVTITRNHHPFEGQSLEVLRSLNKHGRLLFVVFLPDGSKSHIPALWTDHAGKMPETLGLTGTVDHLQKLRTLSDALLQRTASPADAPPASPKQESESHAATESAVHRHSHSPAIPVGTTSSPTATTRRRDTCAAAAESSEGNAIDTNAPAAQGDLS